MKYQKSTLKIYELLVRNPLKQSIIEEIIKEAKVGRTSSFDALRQLEKKGLIKISIVGKQKLVGLVINDAAINFKSFLDSFELRKLNKNISFEINLFIFLLNRIPEIKNVDSILLFGSVLSSKTPKDIDLWIMHSNDLEKEKLKPIRKLIENISDLLINMHFSADKNIYDFFDKMVIYNKSYPIELLSSIDKTFNLKLQYVETLYDIESMINNITNDSSFIEITKRFIINLSYCNCWIEEKINIAKEEAIKLFTQKYSDKLKNLEKSDNAKKLERFKEIANEIGQKIFA